MRISLLHKFWRLVFVAPSRLKERKRKKCANGKAKTSDEEEVCRGDCDDPTTTNKQIRIANNLPMLEELEVVIHECFHACDWWKDEEWIEQVSEDIAHVLVRRLGWVKLDTPEAEKALRKLGWVKQEEVEG